MEADVVLDGNRLTIAGVVAVARGGAGAALAEEARRRMGAARAVVEEALDAGGPVYGLTTGVAERKRVVVAAEEREAWNRRLLRNHRVSQGAPAADDVVRATTLVLANGLANGAAGVRPELVDMILAALAAGDLPPVRPLGSVGQADLGPLADLADGLVERSGFRLAPGEALALIDNNAFAVGSAALAVADAERLLDTLDVAAALDLEGFAGNVSPIHPVVAEVRPYPGLRLSVERLRSLLEGSYLFEPGTARNLQDPLTFRCIPQIHGAARDAFGYTRWVVETELNASPGNPVVDLAERRVRSAGNFDVGPVAAALDLARLALAPVVGSAAERAVKLLQAPWSGLSPGLAAAPERGEDGLSELAVAAQALAVEARTLVHPVSHELVSTAKAEGIEDRTTMAPLAARRLSEMVELVSRVVAIELVVAARAVDLRGGARLGRGTGPAHAAVRRLVPAGGELPVDLEPVVDLVRRGDLAGPSPVLP